MPVTTDLRYVCADCWVRDGDGSVWVDVPARMLALGYQGQEDRQARQQFGRRALRDLREMGIGEGLLVAKVDGLGNRS